jgi:hypothetical protein
MNHYFDDIFHRHTQAKGSKSPRPNMRRSSTSRSIGARSDFGDHSEDEDARSVVNSVAPDSAERLREREEADAHTANYVSEALQRVRSNQSQDFVDGDEFEAQLDEA